MVTKQMAQFSPSEWADLVHPWYGPCDGFEDGRCYECIRVLSALRVVRAIGDEEIDRLHRTVKSLKGQSAAFERKYGEAKGRLIRIKEFIDAQPRKSETLQVIAAIAAETEAQP